MTKLRRFAMRHRWEVGAYAVLGVALWPVPLLGLLHVEASAVVAAASFFVSGLAALGVFWERADGAGSFARALAVQEGLLLLPLALLTATLPWRPNCDYARGLLLFAAMPPVTVAFAVSLAYALTGWRWTRRCARAMLVVVGLVVGVGGPLWDLGLHPQFYTYNHLFGGVLGPLYDRELALRPGFFTFRALTLTVALLWFLIGRWGRLRRRPSAARAAWRALAAAAVVAVLIGAAYAHAARLGFNTPAWHIQEVLGGHRQTAHFDLYYDPDALSAGEVARLAEDHEWHYQRLRERLGTAPAGRVASYLYPDEDTKARLTGARRTSVAPVWLGRPQVHLLQDAYARSFGHELVHAFSREFGMPVLKASRSVGLVEGLAVAFEPPSGRPSPADQVSAAALAGDGSGPSLAEGVAARLSPLGFWTGRGAVSYATMGAFVRFLADRYGAAKLRAVYAWADFEAVYGRPVRALAEEWQAALMDRPRVALSAGALAAARFSRPSLFEEDCPHYVPPSIRAYRRGQATLDEGDTAVARASFREALARQPAFEAARVRRARLQLARAGTGGPRVRARRALRLLQAAPDSSTHGSIFFVTQGDAYALQSQPGAARRSYDRALDRMMPYRHAARAQVILRRALAGRPRLVAAVAGKRAPLAEARRLRRAATGALPPAAAVLRAVLLAEGEQYARAARRLEDAPPVSGLATEGAVEALRRQRHAWAARWAYRAGDPVRAQRHARRAAQSYRAFGDRDAAAQWNVFVDKMQWVRSRPSTADGSEKTDAI